MAPEVSKPRVVVDPTPEAILAAIRAGHLVEATCAIYEAFNSESGSFRGRTEVERLVAEWLDAYGVWDPEIEWHTRSDLPDSRTYRGRRDLARLMAEWIEAFDSLRMDPVEIFETERNVVAVLQFTGRINGSDQQVEMEEVHVFTFGDGTVIETREYPTKAEALRALGLTESTPLVNRFVRPS
jgi:ketosteroid isomerase-like protein